jgi:hypothetical protein
VNDSAKAVSLSRDLTDYEPDRGLKTIAVAEGAERHWARAKNPDKLYEAIEAKLIEQRKYALWRQSVRPWGGRRQGDSTVALPDSDPGKDEARRWRVKPSVRKELLPDTDPGTLPSHVRLARAAA